MPRPFSVASHYHSHRNSPSPSLQFPQLDPRDESQPFFYGSTSHTPRSTQTQLGEQHHCDWPYTQEKHAGAEPGVNPLHSASIAEYSHFVQACAIDVVEYDAKDAVSRRMRNDEFIAVMREQHSLPSAPPPRRVRWINIGGIDWGVLSTLALRYNLHALSLEDILHERGHTHSKADYYPGHVFLRILCHSLQREDSTPCNANLLGHNHAPPSPLAGSEFDLEGGEFPGRGVVTSSPEKMLSPVAEVPIDKLPNDFERTSPSPEMITEAPLPDPVEDATKKGKARMHLSSARHALRRRLTGMSGFMNPAGNKKVIQIRALTKGEGVNVKHEPLFIFLLRDGTVISIHPESTLDYTSPIAERLTQPDSVLRTSEDASLLVQSLLDLVVDRILEVMDEYQLKIHDLEHSILLNPGMDSVRSLHILSGNMILHKRTLDPIKTMIYGLRRYDIDRSAAIASEMALVLDDDEEKRGVDSDCDRESEWDDVGAGLDVKKGKGQLKSGRVEGFFSYKSKVYLADVYDHMDFALTSLDMFSGISENLINYAFNMASYEMNKVMNRLTLATIIFLPLTLLTGYFGMNFDPFWSVNENSDTFFWKIAVPIMAALVPIFMFEDIKTAFRYLQRRRNAQKVVSDWLL